MYYLYINVGKWHFPNIPQPLAPFHPNQLALLLLSWGRLYCNLHKKQLSRNSTSALLTFALGLILEKAFIWPGHIKILSAVPDFLCQREFKDLYRYDLKGYYFSILYSENLFHTVYLKIKFIAVFHFIF